MRVRATLAAVAMAATIVGGLPAAGGDAPPALPHEPGVRILAIGFPSLPDPQPLFDAIVDPGGFVRELAPADDFVRVCGADTGVYDLLVAQFPDEPTALAQEPVLAALPGVTGVYRNHRVVALGASSDDAEGDVAHQDAAEASADLADPDFGLQWALRNTGQEAGDSPVAGLPGYDIRAQGAWDRGVTGEGVVVAVLDEGMDIAHPDLAANVWRNTDEVADNGVDDDGNGWVDDVHGWSHATRSPRIRPREHGTNVAGIVAATARNGEGISGVAPGARLMPVDFITYDLIGATELFALGAFAYAIANGADVINNSWGTLRPAPGEPGSPLLSLAVQCAAAHDVAIAWAGGNASVLLDAWPAYYPAANVLVTGAFRNDGCLDQRLQRNPAVLDVIAPGTDVWTTTPGGYHWFTGTSAATPHTAGVLALVRSAYPELDAVQAVLAVRDGARRPGPLPWSRSLGYLSAEGALAAAADGVLPAELPDDEDNAYTRCEVWPVTDLADGAARAYLDAGPKYVEWAAPGTWPGPMPSTLYPGLPRP